MEKRCAFVENATQASSIENVKVLCARAERAGQNPNHREAYQVVVARAVAKLSVLAEYCLPFVRVGGWFFAPKGFKPNQEVDEAQNAIQTMGGEVVDIKTVASEGPKGMRTVVVMRKIRETPIKYPRKVGHPKKHPVKTLLKKEEAEESSSTEFGLM